MKKIPINGGYGHVGQKIARRLITVGWPARHRE
jgi:uncharacterized protein YbjT (DUF2867 family)